MTRWCALNRWTVIMEANRVWLRLVSLAKFHWLAGLAICRGEMRYLGVNTSALEWRIMTRWCPLNRCAIIREARSVWFSLVWIMVNFSRYNILSLHLASSREVLKTWSESVDVKSQILLMLHYLFYVIMLFKYCAGIVLHVSRITL